MEKSYSVEELKDLYRTFTQLFEEEFVKKNLLIHFDKAWIALHCIDMCVYKHYVIYFSLGLKDFREKWNNIAKKLLEKLGISNIDKEPLRVSIKVGNNVVKMHQLINMFLLWYFSENEELCRPHVENIKYRIKGLSDYAKRLIRIMALDRELMSTSFITFDEKWLGEHYKDRLKEVYGDEVDMKKLEIAVVELNKLGLIMYCNIAIRDFEKLDVKVINEYYIAPHLAPIWRNPDQYLE